ncbi:MAG: tRNA epoxyqueuosine(34) reductase QueG [Terriglobia bacterium]|jgi:epoxyqueuosine reductase
MELKHALKQRALDIGFDLVGIASATPDRDLEFAREWIERGYGGEIRYLANPKRFDPRTVLPSVQSVICVGLIYDTEFPYSAEVGRGLESEVRSQESEEVEGRASIPWSAPSGRGRTRRPAWAGEGEAPHAWISRYAWGRDYHETMRKKLERLRAVIAELAPGAETRVYVDTGPVVERAFARFSGLGWMGKNTCVINEEKGSWFFLGVILTNLQLDPDLPAPDRCGTCRACLDACPTGALVEPYVMDASRCISYLTIEVKGAIPREHRPDIGVNVFGCDICQDVCPWNSKGRFQVSGARCQEKSFLPLTVDIKKLEAGNWKLETGSSNPENRNSELGGDQPSAVSRQPSSDDGVSSIQDPKSQIQNPPETRHPTPDTYSLFAPPLEALASLTGDDFRKLFAHSPIKRAKYRGWLRNLCVAMGNSGDPRFLPKLQELAEHADPIVREHAQWALERLRQA